MSAAAPTAPNAEEPAKRPAPRRGLVGRIGARLADRANPILVRHLRQQLRSKLFIGVYSVTLLTAAVFSIVIGSDAGSRLSSDASASLFTVLAIIWSFALWVVEPLTIFRAVARERDDDTWELILLTGIKPRTVVWGMMQAALVHIALFTAAIAPFIAMAYLLRGLNLMAVLIAIIVIPLAGIAAVSGGVFAACLGPSRQTRVLLGILLTVMCVFAWILFFPFWGALSMMDTLWFDLLSVAPGDMSRFWAVIGFLVNFWAGFCALMLVLGVAMLTSKVQNRSTGPRVIWYIGFFNGLAWIVGLGALDGQLGDGIAAAAMIGAWWTFVLGIFAVSEDWTLSPRQARSITWSRWSIFNHLFGPGAARGRLAYMGLFLLTGYLILTGLLLLERRQEELLQALSVLGYSAIFLLGSDALARGPLQRMAPTAFHRRLVFFLVLLVATLLAVLVPLITRDGTSPFFALSPLSGAAVADERAFDWLPMVIGTLGGICALVLLVQALSNIRIQMARKPTARPAAPTPAAED